MRAGRLQHSITIERLARTVSAAGTVSEVWTPLLNTKAELLNADLAEQVAGFGEAETDTLVFRLRNRPGITTADRLKFAGEAYDIAAIGLISRREMHLKVTK